MYTFWEVYRPFLGGSQVSKRWDPTASRGRLGHPSRAQDKSSYSHPRIAATISSRT